MRIYKFNTKDKKVASNHILAKDEDSAKEIAIEHELINDKRSKAYDVTDEFNRKYRNFGFTMPANEGLIVQEKISESSGGGSYFRVI